MKLKFYLPLIAWFTMVTAAFAASPTPDTVIATVGNVKITQNDLDVAMASLSSVANTKEAKMAVLNELITFNLLAQYGADQNLQTTESFQRAMKDYEKLQLATLAAEKATEQAQKNNTAAITEEDAQKYYEDHKSSFMTPETYRASHILIAVPENATDKEKELAKQKAQKIINQIKSGSLTFEEAAQEKSSCPSKLSGGDLGYFTPGQMVKPFEDAVVKLKIGEMTTKPVLTPFGYHIIKLTDHHEAAQNSFDSVKNLIMEELARSRKTELFGAEVEKLKTKYPVVILWDEYKTQQ